MGHSMFRMTFAGESIELFIVAVPRPMLRALRRVQVRRLQQAKSQRLQQDHPKARIQMLVPQLCFRKERRQRWLRSANGSIGAKWVELRARAATATEVRAQPWGPISQA